MIVSFVCPSAPTPAGGVTVLYEFGNALARRGHLVHLIHGEFWGRRIHSLDEIAWFDFHPAVQHHLIAPHEGFGADTRFPRADVVFATGTPPGFGLHVLLVQGYEMISPSDEQSALLTPCLKICVASWLAHVGRQYGVPPEQFHVVPTGIDHERFRPSRPIPGRPTRVAVLHSTHPAKGWDDALLALRAVKTEIPELEVVAFGTSEPPDLPEWIEFLLNPSPEVLVDEVYSSASVFVQTSRYEGFGLTAVEAMACGAALVTTDNGGSRDYALHGETASVVPPGDVDLLAAAIIDLLADDAKRVRIADAGERYVRRFDWDLAADALEGHLERYVADPTPVMEAVVLDDRPDPAGRSWGDWANWLLEGLDPVPIASRADFERIPSVDGGSGTVVGTPFGRDSIPASSPAGEQAGATTLAEEDLVLNLVWTGDTFEQLSPFTLSLLRHGRARLRFVGNACPPEELDRMERFAEAHPGRVVEVLDVSSRRMVRHGDALHDVLAARDDGPAFAFMDPDIYVRGPYLERFLQLLGDHEVVTSGRELWSTSNVLPEGHIGVNGEYFFDRDGFVFGSPHFAVYRRDALLSTLDRWGVTFASAGDDIPAPARRRLEEMGRSYWVYDTAKVVNLMLQADGCSLAHEEHPNLVHVGGVSHFLAPPVGDRSRSDDGPQWGEEADWGKWDGMADRYAVARYAAGALAAASAGLPVPPSPEGVNPRLIPNLEMLAADVAELVGGAGRMADV